MIKLPIAGLNNTQDSTSSDEDDNGPVPPVGDIADLTASVSKNAAVPRVREADGPTNFARVCVYTTKKNKGIGKGTSGSSGPPPKRKPTSTVSRQPTPSSSDETSSDEEQEATATQTIMVGSKRGYTYYPGYIFDIPPKKLKTDTLRKKLMISEIKRSETQTEFYERGMVLMGHLKEFMKHLMSGKYGETSKNKSTDEHGYAINDNSSDDEDEQHKKKPFNK